jgi:ribose 5-phosphate isomerase A
VRELPMNAERWKRRAAERALAYVDGGMTIGLGSGSTAAAFVELAAARVGQGLDIRCVATSETTRAQAQSLGIALTTLDCVPFLDLTVDGADEIDGELRLIKGGGGALLREKIVATASKRMVVIADASKRVATLGKFPLAVEIVQFGRAATRNMLSAAAAEVGCSGEITLRMQGGEPFITDNGNYILDCRFGRIEHPEALDAALKRVPGIVENGLFLGIADVAIVAGPEGIDVIERPPRFAC